MKGWTLFSEGMTMDHLGLIPMMMSADDPRTLKEQIEENYAHGGGWRSRGMEQFTFDPITALAKFPGDPPMRPMAQFVCRSEALYFYDYAIVAVVDVRGVAEFSRMD